MSGLEISLTNPGLEYLYTHLQGQDELCVSWKRLLGGSGRTHTHTCTAKPSDRPKELLLRNLLLVFQSQSSSLKNNSYLWSRGKMLLLSVKTVERFALAHLSSISASVRHGPAREHKTSYRIHKEEYQRILGRLVKNNDVFSHHIFRETAGAIQCCLPASLAERQAEKASAAAKLPTPLCRVQSPPTVGGNPALTSRDDTRPLSFLPYSI